MGREGWAVLPLMLLVACGGAKDPAAKLMETGWFSDTGLFDAGSCKHRLGGVIPSSGTDDWYYRDAPWLFVEKAGPAEYTVELVDSTGVPAPVTPVWTDDELKLSLELNQPLKPSHEYFLTVTDCAAVHRSSFFTSSYGQPLLIDPTELTGRTYLLDMLGADWVKPGGAEALIQLYFSAPALLGIRLADPQRIDLLGAPGEVDPFGGVTQGLGSTWDFPTADFDTHPYFESDANLVVFQFEGVEIPIHNARLAATFSPDGVRLGGGELSGLGDTRDLGEFLPGGGANNPSAICDLAESLGIDCEACPDGLEYCMSLEARDLSGALVDGLTLVPRN